MSVRAKGAGTDLEFERHQQVAKAQLIMEGALGIL